VELLKPRSQLCERTRGWVSLSLDGELSEFERALVGSHLDRCAQCAAFAREVTGATHLLRDAPLAPVPHMVVLPARRRNIGALTLRAGAAAALLIGALGLAGSLTISSDSGLGPARVTHGVSDDTNERLIRLSQRQAMTPLPPQNTRHSVLMPL
jgi:predicted anti-sigma-YlaC factor YlaD